MQEIENNNNPKLITVYYNSGQFWLCNQPQPLGRWLLDCKLSNRVIYLSDKFCNIVLLLVGGDIWQFCTLITIALY